ncbi:DALR anticodon-binding domain-containing protein [Tumidithrix elongata RA019]|uniref:DALR anticodon-binding domain-containing protein n=1 Tax=Tumidithrix elongata BACA0141 TaxID=2716417 RepID=A0AAW9Q4B6_9CYAN|nr:DALR anticodon-binding domain-containing protein [Tumidithrix elongata RA019]
MTLLIAPSQILKARLMEAIALEFDREFAPEFVPKFAPKFDSELNNELKEPICVRLKPSQLQVKAGYPKYSSDETCHYTTSVSLSLGNLCQLDPLIIANRLRKRLEAIADSQFTTQVSEKGWLNFELSDRFLIDCLAALYDWQPDSINRNYEAPWEVQYAYTRCCALLRLAEREGLLCDRQIPFRWQPFEPKPKFLFQEPAEIQLVMAQLAIADRLTDESQAISVSMTLKLCEAIAKSFLSFYDACRIFGVSQNQAVIRVSLLCLTQKLLIFLAPAPVTNCTAL